MRSTIVPANIPKDRCKAVSGQPVKFLVVVPDIFPPPLCVLGTNHEVTVVCPIKPTCGPKSALTNQIKCYLSHAPNITGEPYSETLT